MLRTTTLLLALCACLSTGVTYDAIVVGLGPSGIAAISKLAEKGYKVLGLEAKSRVGGRVNTHEFGGGTVELGAEWIHGEVGNVVHELARAHGVAISDYKWRKRAADPAGHNESAVVELLDYCFAVADDAPEESQNETLASYVEKKFREYIANTTFANETEFCANILRAAELAIATADGFDSWAEMTVASHNDFDEAPGSQGWSWGATGYRTLFDILLHKYKNDTGLSVEMKLNSEVTSIDTSDVDKVTVTVAGGETYVAKAVIVTVSVGVLKHSHEKLFTPPLPADKQGAIQAISIGTVDKICLHYEKPWWDDPNNYYIFVWRDEDRKKVTEADKWTTEVSGYSISISNPRVLTLWLTGEGARAMEQAGEATVRAGAEAVLHTFFGKVPPADNMTRTRWHSDLHTRGSYSYHTAGAVGAANMLLARPIGRLHFAGEASSARHYGTVHGAVESGWREADNVHHLLSSH